jgi:serine/threonine protein kinase
VAELAPRVPGYRLGAELGRGGSGVVYAARREADDAEVAVKVLRPDLGAAHRDLLRTEARRAARVQHPGVLPVLESGDEDGVAWLVLPKVDGLDLRALLERRGPLSPAEAVAVVGQVAEAVAAVHAAGLVHRDIKPANVLVRNDSTVLLADLGIAVPLPEAEHDSLFSHWSGEPGSGELEWTDTGAERAAGTLAYMAPEQWRGDQATVASDVYALGGTLYAALTGRRPFEQTGLAALAFAVGSQDPKPPSAFGAPPAFDGVVATALAKRPEQRFPDAAAFSRALRRAAAGGPPDRQLRAAVLAAIGVVVGLAVVAGALVLPYRPITPPAGVVTRQVCAQHMTLRARPGSGGGVEQTLDNGETLRIDRSRDDGAWSFATTPDGHTGWVLSQYLCH